ncbi:DNA polymerase I [Nanchangia anserum]|uniref:DNA polymerase I n=1 Tax=Nanchangia anserum TaxID=2692125 RepID=A0A8I0GEP0_9ACTO|nr:DNA polymerase I [Nanchangia anserum]MBD3688699.1 DNA polymerase I [Nanchangia anserum]QOX82446.1 DNA polymerase I [Nanchangia anserum]
MTSSRLLLIDGHSLAFRAYYAMRSPEDFQTSTGQMTNAVFVFCRMLMRLVNDYEPGGVAVAFDTSTPTFRKELYPEYKDGRRETPESLPGQIEIIQQALGLLGIRSLTKPGFEADDIVATLARHGEEDGRDVLIVSSDRDMYQLVTDQVHVLSPGSSTQKLNEFSPQEIREKTGVSPDRYRAVAALVGEGADNIPGVPGIGKVTAAKLINEYDTIDNLLDHADEIRGKRGQALRESVDLVRRNLQLNELRRDLDLPVAVGDLEVGAGNLQAWEELCDDLEFTSLRTQVWHALDQIRPLHARGEREVEERRLSIVDADSLSGGLLAWAGSDDATIGVDVVGRTSPGRGDADIVSLARGTEAVTVELRGDEAIVTQLRQLLAEYADRLAYADFKAAWHALRGAGIEAQSPGTDVALCAHVLAPAATDYDVESLAREYLGRTAPSDADAGTLFGDEAAPSAWRAQVVADLVPVLVERLEQAKQLDLVRVLEQPVTPILARMEDAGITVDEERLEALIGDLTHQVERAREQACAVVERPDLNLSSPKQLQEVLFEQLKMPPTRKTKRGYTTNAEALQQLYVSTQHPFLAYLLEHRDKIKLLQVVESLAKHVQPDGRIHTEFLQTKTTTGRLSSIHPNLQNIPARTPTGMAIREVFVAGEGYDGLMTADYSQIEMRVMAALSQDPGLIAAFSSGEDLHQTMAAMVFGVAPEEVTPEQRSKIKATSYGLAYGLSVFGLSRQLDISQAEARHLRDAYFSRFGGIRDYLESLVARARKTGYTETILGRRRYLMNLASLSRTEQQAAERAALNAPIQGSAADIIKSAMIMVDAAMREAGLRSRLLLQVHDELIVEVAPGERDQLEELLRHNMATAASLDVSLDVSVGYGATWREAAH